MNPMNVLRMATAMQGKLKRILLVGCEPATLGGEEGKMGLSEPVQAAVREAMKVVEKLVEKTLHEAEPESLQVKEMCRGHGIG